jgi:hypothetical protein
MRRWVWFLACTVVGLLLLLCGLWVPAHLRAVDTSLLEKAGRSTPSLVDVGLNLVNQRQLGAADLILETADNKALPGRERLGQAVDDLAKQNRGARIWGSGEPHLEILFGSNRQTNSTAPEPFTDFVIRTQNRARVLELLRVSPRPGVGELLRTRNLTNTTIFPPAQSASGQAFDAALCICGLLLEEGRLGPGLSNAVVVLAQNAITGGSSVPFEEILIDMMSLGQRFNYGQLAVLLGRVEDPETLHLLGHVIRRGGEHQQSVLFSAVTLSGKPMAVATYMMNYGQTGLADVGEGLRYRAGGLNELLRRNQRLSASVWEGRLAVESSLRTPRFALTVKWLFFLGAGFLLALAMHFARPAVSTLERPLQVRGFHYAREILFALGFLLVVLMLTEPFLSTESQKVEFPFRLQLPIMGKEVPAKGPGAKAPFMNPTSLLTLLLFFVLQGLIYIACVVKLAEIKRQNLPTRIKLRLLENEEHLFDAGLYLGFCGTIISLILVSLQVIQPSLMAAYGSTSFGIIFVSIFKIFHLRPARRKMLLQSEAGAPDNYASAPVGARTVATPP